MNTQKLDDTLRARTDADMTHHADCPPLVDDLYESRYGRLQSVHAERYGALQTVCAARLDELTTARDDLAAAHIRINCLQENLSFYAKTLAESEAARDGLVKQNDELRSQIAAFNSASDRALAPDDKRAWRTLEAFWVAVFVACIIVAIKSCGGA